MYTKWSCQNVYNIAQSGKGIEMHSTTYPVYTNFRALGNLAGIILFLCRIMQLLSSMDIVGNGMPELDDPNPLLVD